MVADAQAESQEPGAASQGPAAEVWRLLATIADPEIPVLSLCDLGVVRHVRWIDGTAHVGITPTYSGCPATEVIRQAVVQSLHGAGCAGAVVEEVLSPPWTSDWITESGKRKLRSFGIDPPGAPASAATCPRCGSKETERVSEFGSTPCKAHYKCTDCLEPFDRFKCI